MNDMFLGSFFMQFKTYATAKMEQWFMKPGASYNVQTYKEVVDEDTGERLYERLILSEENSNGIPSIETITESQWKELPAEEKEK